MFESLRGFSYARLDNGESRAPWTSRRVLVASSLCTVTLLILFFISFEGSTLSEGALSNARPESDPLILGPGAQQKQDPPLDQCASIPPGILSVLQSSTARSTTVTSNGAILSESQSHPGPLHACILVALPQSPVLNPDTLDYIDPLVSGKGPDLVHLIANSTDVTLTFPPLRPLPGQDIQQSNSDALIYYAELVLLQAGTYDISATHEFDNWKWAQQWHVDYGTLMFPDGTSPDQTFAEHAFRPVPLPTVSLTILGDKSLPSLPLCDHQRTAARGRWYRHDAFPSLPAEMSDESGYVWQGDSCHLPYLRPSDVSQCLQNRNLHIYGDSMIRRVTKSLINGGEWCRDVHGQCQDEDDRGYVPLSRMLSSSDGLEPEWVPYSEEEELALFSHDGITTVPFGNSAAVDFMFVTTITNQTSEWTSRFYASEDLEQLTPAPVKSTKPDFEIRPGAAPRLSPGLHKPDAVILGFGAWDEAFTDAFDAYHERLESFRRTVLEVYADVPIAMRLANSWCCRSTGNGFRRYTGGRVQEFDDRTRRVFRVQHGLGGLETGITEDEKVRLIDPSAMNGRKEMIFDFGVSDANHPRASHVRIELMMLMASLCEKTDDGWKWRG